MSSEKGREAADTQQSPSGDPAVATSPAASSPLVTAPSPQPDSIVAASQPEPAAVPPNPARSKLVGSARRYLGKRPRLDCSGFIRRVFADAKLELPTLAPARSRSESMYQALPKVTSPRPGDLAFFHSTYDRDGRTSNPRRNRFTHVAMVESVDGPHLTLIHRGRRGVQRFVMNLEEPDDPEENGQLRLRKRRDRPGLQYLAGQLFAGFASPFDAEEEPVGRSAAAPHPTSDLPAMASVPAP